jgi:tyrosyl-tRNA synthetase
MTTIDQQVSHLLQGTTEVISEGEIRRKLCASLDTGRPLRVKLGADPTAPDIHLGHTVVIRRLRAFQQLGHTVIFLIGDFTGLIGDPSGKSATRPQLRREEIAANAETYKRQIFKLLDPEKTEIRFNSEWMDRLGSDGFVRLASHVTVKQILERDDFQKRLSEEHPVALHELLYPLIQGYDSVVLEADVEIGGTDQKFNLLMGRSLQRERGQEPQAVLITPLLEGTDGVQKMSKSLGNYVGIDEPPQEMFGKIMSISDELMWRYYELLTDLTVGDIRLMRARVESSEVNPRDLKAALAKRVISDFHPKSAANAAEEDFIRKFRNKEVPDEVEEQAVAPQIWKLPRLLVETGLTPSMAEARRLIDQGGVRLGGERITDVMYEVVIKDDSAILLQVGRRRFLRVLGTAPQRI